MHEAQASSVSNRGDQPGVRSLDIDDDLSRDRNQEISLLD